MTELYTSSSRWPNEIEQITSHTQHKPEIETHVPGSKITHLLSGRQGSKSSLRVHESIDSSTEVVTGTPECPLGAQLPTPAAASALQLPSSPSACPHAAVPKAAEGHHRNDHTSCAHDDPATGVRRVGREQPASCLATVSRSPPRTLESATYQDVDPCALNASDHRAVSHVLPEEAVMQSRRATPAGQLNCARPGAQHEALLDAGTRLDDGLVHQQGDLTIRRDDGIAARLDEKQKSGSPMSVDQRAAQRTPGSPDTELLPSQCAINAPGNSKVAQRIVGRVGAGPSSTFWRAAVVHATTSNLELAAGSAAGPPNTCLSVVECASKKALKRAQQRTLFGTIATSAPASKRHSGTPAADGNTPGFIPLHEFP